MIEREPELFKNWCSYMKLRQVMASAALFRDQGWTDWHMGHAKLFGIVLWNYETKKIKKFRYCHTLKRQGYGRTHNYRLLKELVENNFLTKEGNGYYSLVCENLESLEKVLLVIRELDMIDSGKKIILGGKKNGEALHGRFGLRGVLQRE